jgi:hypothetical protein
MNAVDLLRVAESAASITCETRLAIHGREAATVGQHPGRRASLPWGPYAALVARGAVQGELRSAADFEPPGAAAV